MLIFKQGKKELLDLDRVSSGCKMETKQLLWCIFKELPGLSRKTPAASWLTFTGLLGLGTFFLSRLLVKSIDLKNLRRKMCAVTIEALSSVI